VVEANVEEPDSRDLQRLLRFGGEWRKKDANSENDREPDTASSLLIASLQQLSHRHRGW
jgi:hypothetical protein